MFYAEGNKSYTYNIDVQDGWNIHSITYNGTDVTNLVKDNIFIAPPLAEDSELNIAYESTQNGIADTFSNNVTVNAFDNNIVISNTLNGDNIAIYTISGDLIDNRISSGGLVKITLVPNLYIVKINDKSIKIKI